MRIDPSSYLSMLSFMYFSYGNAKQIATSWNVYPLDLFLYEYNLSASFDIPQAEAFIAGYKSRYVIADKGCDSQAFRAVIANNGQVAVIPPQSYRKTPRGSDRQWDKQRNLIERFIV